jgi:predicted DNA-binding transcriptional regulator AlpA
LNHSVCKQQESEKKIEAVGRFKRRKKKCQTEEKNKEPKVASSIMRLTEQLRTLSLKSSTIALSMSETQAPQVIPWKGQLDQQLFET